MFERLRRLIRNITAPADDEPESIDNPRPKRANPDPPRRDWFARLQDRSLDAQALAEVETRKLDARDRDDPKLTREAERAANDLLARIGTPPPRRR